MPFDPTELAHFLPCLMGHIPPAVHQALPQLQQHIPPALSRTPRLMTRWRLAHFLGQCAHESGHFQHVYENLNYGEADLHRLFAKYFSNATLLAQYAHHPKKVAARIYANRMGNGDESSQDGYHFRGRGYIQLTGKDNYAQFSAFIGQDCVANPDWVATRYPLLSAAFFFHRQGIWGLCDTGCGADVVERITRRVNGGTHGLAQRTRHFQGFLDLLGPPLNP